MKKIAIIGAGFSGLSAATCLAHAGYEVTVFEKNSTAGGRARQLDADGYIFDMGPSWYWMPDVFESYFGLFGKKVSEYYDLHRMDPSYRVVFSDKEHIDLPAGDEALIKLFGEIEPGSGARLRQFLKEAKEKYDIALREFIFKPGISWMEFARPALLPSVLKLHIFRSMTGYIRKFFRDPRLIKILEFPVLFLGAAPSETPALYSLMNYADMSLGTWYPTGGMYSVVKGMVKLAEEKGVRFRYDTPVEAIRIENNHVIGIDTRRGAYGCDALVASADYHHVEQHLLAPEFRTYDERYWDKRVLAPSSLLFYLGLNKKLDNVLHHTLFFDTDFDLHAREIYADQKWPTSPQFYLSCSSMTDNTVAPPGCDALVILVPVAPGLSDGEEIREKYFNMIMNRLEHVTGQSVRPHVVVKRSYALSDFIADYNSYKGNAYGLANTLRQTATLKPSMINRKVRNLFYCGHLTVPGPGVPTAIISGRIVAKELIIRSPA